jgi:hypothetical protein
MAARAARRAVAGRPERGTTRAHRERGEQAQRRAEAKLTKHALSGRQGTSAAQGSPADVGARSRRRPPPARPHASQWETAPRADAAGRAPLAISTGRRGGLSPGPRLSSSPGKSPPRTGGPGGRRSRQERGRWWTEGEWKIVGRSTRYRWEVGGRSLGDRLGGRWDIVGRSSAGRFGAARRPLRAPLFARPPVRNAPCAHVRARSTKLLRPRIRVAPLPRPWYGTCSFRLSRLPSVRGAGAPRRTAPGLWRSRW